MAEPGTVDFTLSGEQQMLRETTRDFLTERLSSASLRDVIDSDGGFDAGLWKAGAGLGWHSLAIPEEYGGAGYTFVELSVVLEELGRALFPGPFVSTVVMATSALLGGATDEQNAVFLPRIASGEALMALAVREGAHPGRLSDADTVATRDGEDWVLRGTKSHVVFGHVADTVLTTAMTESGVSLFLVSVPTEGFTVTPVHTLDGTRKQAHLEFDGVRVGPESLLGAEGAAAPLIAEMIRLGQVAMALEEVGAAQWCLETSVAHAQTRYQFGRSIGSFQAIKHRCADMLVAIEHARSASYYGARVADDPHELAIAGPLALMTASDAHLAASAETIQILGGTGFTWEHDAHLYLKRAKASSLMFGGVHEVRRQLADAIGI